MSISSKLGIAGVAVAIGLGSLTGAAVAQNTADPKLEQNRALPIIQDQATDPATQPDTLSGRVAPPNVSADIEPGTDPDLAENPAIAPTQAASGMKPAAPMTEAEGQAYNKATHGAQDDAVNPAATTQ